MNELWTWIASMMGLLTLLQTVVPLELRHAVVALLRRAMASLCHGYTYFHIAEFESVCPNELYSAVQLHLGNSASVASASRLNLSRVRNSNRYSFSLTSGADTAADSFAGATILWRHIVSQREGRGVGMGLPWRDEMRSYEMCIRSHDRERVLVPYLDHVMEQAAAIRRASQERFLYTNSRGGGGGGGVGGGGLDSRGQPWEGVAFKHPSTFRTLAMDPQRKADVMADLDSFVAGKEFYANTGRAWKRGYLLYGPPGTGKSSMIAAMANHLGYDVYDLELTEVSTNAELRRLLIKTTNKSIIVIEDIDCSLNLSNRAAMKRPALTGPIPGAEEPSSLSLSGLLNFTDGLWSCCGSERIFVFTTNHIEKLDPALLRPGRMDMHICMSFCTFESLKILIQNYLGFEHHRLFAELKQVVASAQITPADASEILIKNRLDPGRAMEELMQELQKRACKCNGRVPASIEQEQVEEEQEKRPLDTLRGFCGTQNSYGENCHFRFEPQQQLVNHREPISLATKLESFLSLTSALYH